MRNFYKSVTLAAMALAFAAHPSFAQTMVVDPGHPRVTEVDQRLANAQAQVSQALGSGQLRPREAGHDQAHLSKLSSELQADEAANAGHISPKEQMKLNRQLDKFEEKLQRQIAGLPPGAIVAPAGTMAPPPGGMMAPPPGAVPPPPPGQ